MAKCMAFCNKESNHTESVYRLHWKTGDISPITKTLVAFLTGGKCLMQKTSKTCAQNKWYKHETGSLTLISKKFNHRQFIGVRSPAIVWLCSRNSVKTDFNSWIIENQASRLTTPKTTDIHLVDPLLIKSTLINDHGTTRTTAWKTLNKICRHYVILQIDNCWRPDADKIGEWRWSNFLATRSHVYITYFGRRFWKFFVF